MKKLISAVLVSILAMSMVSCSKPSPSPTPSPTPSPSPTVEANAQTPSPSPSVAPSPEPSTSQAPVLELVVGTNPEFPPFEYLNDANEVDGFDIALMKEIASRLELSFKVESMEFKGLIGALKAGKINVIAAGMTINEERLLDCDFTDPYINSVQVVLVKKDSELAKAEDLNGKKIAVQEGTTGDFIATDDVEGAEISRFKRYLDAITELNNGRVDAVIIDSSPAAEFLKKNDGIKQVEDLVMADEEYGIAVKKGNKELLDQLNAALDEIKKDGTFDKLVEEYITNEM